MDFASKCGKNKLHFKAFALKLLQQNQLNKLSNVIFRLDVVSKNVLYSLGSGVVCVIIKVRFIMVC